MARYSSLEQLPRFETVSECFNETYRRIDILRTVGGYKNLKLAEKLSQCCETENRCQSAACRICNRKFRIKMVNRIVEKVRTSPYYWQVMTIIDYSHAFTDDDFSEFDHRKAKDRLRKQLERNGFTGPVLGTLEIDFHEKYGLWLPHFHLVYPNNPCNVSALKRLRKSILRIQRFHIDEMKTARPLMSQRIKKPYTQISYVFKLLFFRVYEYKCRLSGTSKTQKKRLYHSMYCRTLIWMDRVTVRGLYFSFRDLN